MIEDDSLLNREEAQSLGVWRMANGQCIRVSEMSDTHLRNVHRHMWRRARAAYDEFRAASFYSPASPDSMAAYYADRAADELWEHFQHCRGWLDIFKKEMNERKIAPHDECKGDVEA